MTLGSLKDVVRRCDLMVTNDTGPRHVAAAFGVPVVTVFGPTHPEWTDIYYPAERQVRIDVFCGPCQKKVCPLDHRCMTGVTPDMVWDAACSCSCPPGPPSRPSAAASPSPSSAWPDGRVRPHCTMAQTGLGLGPNGEPRPPVGTLFTSAADGRSGRLNAPPAADAHRRPFRWDGAPHCARVRPAFVASLVASHVTQEITLEQFTGRFSRTNGCAVPPNG